MWVSPAAPVPPRPAPTPPPTPRPPCTPSCSPPPAGDFGDAAFQGSLVHRIRYLASVVTQNFSAFGELLALPKRFAEISGGITRVSEALEVIDASAALDAATVAAAAAEAAAGKQAGEAGEDEAIEFRCGMGGRRAVARWFACVCRSVADLP